MALFGNRRARRGPVGGGPTQALSDILLTHDAVDVTPEYMIVTPKIPNGSYNPNTPIQLAGGPTTNAVNPSVDYRELGSASTSPWTSWIRQEYNPELRGVLGLRVYDKMRKSDATVRGTLRLVKTPVLAARWFMAPASESTRDKNVAEEVWKNLTTEMSTSWPQLLTECLLMCDFGYFMFEKVFAVKDPGTSKERVIWSKLASRHPMDVLSWKYDTNGGPNGVVMAPSQPEDDPAGVFIPIDKLLVFTFDKESGIMEGTPVLRSAYQHWYYKTQLYKIDAIQKERHGIGIPVIKLPINFSASDKDLANQMGRNLRTNERAHIVLPPNWDVIFAQLGGNPVDALKSAEHHDAMIQQNILASFMKGGAKDEDQVMFLKSTRFIADIVEDIFNKYAIPQLVDFNYSRVGYPTLTARRIGEQADWRTLSFAIRNLIGSGVLRPDDRLENYLRDEMDLPPVEPSTTRLVPVPRETINVAQTNPLGAGADGGPSVPVANGPVGGASKVVGAPAPPQLPRVGLPRQSQAVNQKIGPSAPGKAGFDRSGG